MPENDHRPSPEEIWFKELDLDPLEARERPEVYAAFGPEENMQVYGRGIRRRLAPMIGRDRVEMATALLCSLPGSPVVLYGDEIGLGEDLSRPERWSVRTRMDWSLVSEDPSSILPRVRRILTTRRDTPEIGSGHTAVIRTDEPAVLALRHECPASTVVTVVNVSRRPVRAAFVPDVLQGAVQILSDGASTPDGSDVDLAPYGYGWFRLGS